MKFKKGEVVVWKDKLHKIEDVMYYDKETYYYKLFWIDYAICEHELISKKEWKYKQDFEKLLDNKTEKE